MIGLDTNILVRFVMADHPDQSAKARTLLQSLSSDSPAVITLVCLAELVWVLRSRYRQPKRDVIDWVARFLESPEFVVEDHAAVGHALRTYAIGSAEFSDCLIAQTAIAAGCTEIVTFDARAAKSAGMRLLR